MRIRSTGLNGYAEMFALFKRRAVRHVLFAVCAQGMVSFTTAAFVGAHLHDRFGFSLAAIGLVLDVFALGGLTYSFAAAPVLVRIGERGALALGGIMFSLCFSSLAIATDWRLYVPALFLAGIGLMMVHNIFQVHATQMAPESRGAALSLFAAMIFLGQTIGFAAASLAYDRWGGIPIFLTAAVLFPVIAFSFLSTIAKG